MPRGVGLSGADGGQGSRAGAVSPQAPARPGPGAATGRMFAALAVPNFRLYLAGQAVS